MNSIETNTGYEKMYTRQWKLMAASRNILVDIQMETGTPVFNLLEQVGVPRHRTGWFSGRNAKELGLEAGTSAWHNVYVFIYDLS